MPHQVEQQRAPAAAREPASAVDSTALAAALRLYLVYPKGGAVILVAARDEERARSFPPFSNWRMLVKFGSWSPVEGRWTRCKLIGVAAVGVEAGPVLFGSM